MLYGHRYLVFSEGRFARDKHLALLKIVRKRVIYLRLDATMRRNHTVLQHQQQLRKANGTRSSFAVSGIGLLFTSAVIIGIVSR